MPADPADATPILALPMIAPAQAQKHVTHNEALRLLDLVVQLAVADRDRTDPPAAPADGDRHIVAAPAAGDWAGREGQVALRETGVWAFVAPRPGWRAHVLSEAATVVFDGAAWSLPAGQGAGSLQNLPGLGVNAASDATNRLSVSAPATLLSHEGAGHRLSLNKAAPGDTASLLFQTGFSGRAEMGLAGTDGFDVRVSADGSGWITGIRIDAATGAPEFPASPAFKGVLAADATVSPGGWRAIAGFSGLVDRTGAFDAATGVFTAPAPGLYAFTFAWRYKASGQRPSAIRAGLGVNGATPTAPEQRVLGGSGPMDTGSTVAVSTMLDLAAGDRVAPRALSSGGDARAEASFTTFWGHRLA